MEKLLTCEQVSEIFSLSKYTIYNLVSESRIPCFRINKRLVRFRESELERWLKNFKQHGRLSRKPDVSI